MHQCSFYSHIYKILKIYSHIATLILQHIRIIFFCQIKIKLSKFDPHAVCLINLAKRALQAKVRFIKYSPNEIRVLP